MSLAATRAFGESQICRVFGSVILLLLSTGPAMAACSVSVSALTTPYLPQNASATTLMGNVTVTCSILSGLGTYSISLSSGSGGSYAGRKMTGPSMTLPYQLYSDAALTKVWGNGSAGTSTVAGIDTVPLLGGTSSYPIYFKISAGNLVNPGTYTDTTTVATLTY